MGIKYFCDGCGKETKDYRSEWENFKLVEVKRGLVSEGHYRDMYFCEKCTEKIKEAFGII